MQRRVGGPGRSAILALLATVAVIATACQSTSSTSSSPAAPSAAASQNPDASATPTPAGSPAADACALAASADKSGTLTIWDFQYESEGWGGALKELDAQFQAGHPNVKIDHVGQPYETYNQLVQTAFTSNSAPDVLMFLPGASGLFQWGKGLEVLTPRVDQAMRDRLIGWDAVSDKYDLNGDVLGIPVGLQGQVVYVNKQLWSQAGLDPAALPTTYDELVSASKKLKDAGISPFASGNKEGYENGWWLNIFWPSFATQADSWGIWTGDIPWTDQRVVDAMQPYLELGKQEFFDKGRFSTPLFPDGGDLFATGKGAMFLGLISSDVSYVQFNKALGAENVGYFQPPSFGAGTPAFLPVGPQIAWAVAKSAADKDLAWEYVGCITSSTAMQLQFDKGGVIPNDKTTELSVAPPQVLGFLNDYDANPVQLPMDAIIQVPVYDEFIRQINLALLGEITLQQALEATDKVAKQAISESN